MPSNSLILGVVIGSTLIALLLTGSSQSDLRPSNPVLPADLMKEFEQGKTLLSQGSYYAARESFLRASAIAQKRGYARQASRNLTNAGFCLYASLNFRGAQQDFEKSRDMARAAGELAAVAAAQNNLANLYIHMAEPEKALEVAEEALRGPEGSADASTHGKLLFQRADALAELKRFPEAEPVYRQAIAELAELDDYEGLVRVEGKFGYECLHAERWDEAESILTHALWMVRVHHVNASAVILTSLAQLKSHRGDIRSATALFESAINAPQGTAPAWGIRWMRGQFRLEHGDPKGALDDYREARRIALEMKADMVPADQDRIELESNLSEVMEGLVESGNRLARQTGDHKALRETFDAAEQDRMWSLRALVPSPNDWRSRLPNHYWELLAQYQALEGTAASARSPEAVRKIESLRAELQGLEAESGGMQNPANSSESALAHAQSLLDGDSVLLSFLITKTGGWVWAVDRNHVDVYPTAGAEKITKDTATFRNSVQAGSTDFTAAREVYRDLFGNVPENYLRRRRWLIEPDGPLNDLPFAALVPGESSDAASGRFFLVQRTAIGLVPGALLMERGTIAADAPFVGVGDPIYNGADSRYRFRNVKAGFPLPRLPNTAAEIEAVSRAWGTPSPTLLTGADATPANVEAALRRPAPVVHFATHVVAAPEKFRSGMIALSLDASGEPGLLGPKEIVARLVSPGLVVMNGCHSAQGETLPSSGLMGLTRAWIGAGSRAVIATGWDVPDAAAQSLMTDFYVALHSRPQGGTAFALRSAQLKAIERGDSPARWAAYSLLTRIP